MINIIESNRRYTETFEYREDLSIDLRNTVTTIIEERYFMKDVDLFTVDKYEYNSFFNKYKNFFNLIYKLSIQYYVRDDIILSIVDEDLFEFVSKKENYIIDELSESNISIRELVENLDEIEIMLRELDEEVQDKILL